MTASQIIALEAKIALMRALEKAAMRLTHFHRQPSPGKCPKHSGDQ